MAYDNLDYGRWLPDVEDVQATFVSQHVPGDLLIKRKHSLINCCTVISEEVTDNIIPLYTSEYYGHGKKPVLEKATSDHEAREFLCQVGEGLELDDMT